MNDFKPMLAGKAPHLDDINYPVLVSPKLDGIRALVINGRVVSRNLIEIPCPTVQEFFGDPTFEGFDGELIVGDPTAKDAFRRTESCVMSEKPLVGIDKTELVFYVFDDFARWGPFNARLANLSRRILKRSKVLKVVPHDNAINRHAIDIFEEEYVADGYEGLMIRDPNGNYKFGRSTTKQGLLLKLKRFEDAEAVVIGCKELQHNQNVDRTGGLAQRRSSKAAGKVGGQVLGAFQVRGVNGQFKDVEFDVGTGLSRKEREKFWASKSDLVGKVLKYRYFALGAKDKPRFPSFQGFRSDVDL